MAADKGKKVLQDIPYAIDDREFLEAVHEKIAKQEEQSTIDPLVSLLKKEYIAVSRSIDQSTFQDSWSWRNVHIAKELAKHLIDVKGEFREEEGFKALRILQQNLFSLGPERHHDARRQLHLLKALEKILYDDKFRVVLRRIGRPIGHQIAERLIRETCALKEFEPITDAHARQAVLSAFFTLLRQNVGSCFATAPAIMIQQEQELQFFSDLELLLSTGRLKRVVEGIEHAVPLSTSWGVGDLYRPFFLSSLGKNPNKILANSPGLLAALQAAGLIDETNQESKEEWCEKLLETSPLLQQKSDPFLVLTPDGLLRSLLLNFFGITENDITQYQLRPREGIIGDFVIQMPQVREGKALSCLRFLKGYEAAKSAFKSYTDHPLLKAWEFTLASLSETKADFAKWNLYSSLGLDPKEPYGLGECFQKNLEAKIAIINKDLEEYQSRHDHVFAQLKSLEGRANRAGSDSELSWIQAEYQTRRFELHRILSERDEIYEKGRSLANLFSFLIHFYTQKFVEYFQEIYDAEMLDVTSNPYDDSPAGFRLLFKHGRTNTALWSLITTPNEYIQSLTTFFVSTEIELSHHSQVKNVQSELTELISSALVHIRQKEFLESSFYRLARAYHEPIVEDPLENLDRVKRKPWAYISGGTMSTLVSCYYSLTKKPEEKTRWVESETELLVFFLDTFKELPPKEQRKVLENPERPLLAFSPTHAFLFKGGWKPFTDGWESKVYTYTWVRDNWIAPQQRFLSSFMLDSRMMDVVIEAVSKAIPVGYQPLFKNLFRTFTHPMNPVEFREHIVKTLSYERWMQQGRHLEWISEEIDSALFSMLPFFPEYQLKERLETLFDQISEIDSSMKKNLSKLFEETSQSMKKYKIMSANDLRNVAKALLLLEYQTTKTPIPFHQKITSAMQKTGLGYPMPILFADTNWVKNTFGFIVNPGTGRFEFWRFDDCGSEGRPMSVWKHYLNGSSRYEWGLYTSPSQYYEN